MRARGVDNVVFPTALDVRDNGRISVARLGQFGIDHAIGLSTFPRSVPILLAPKIPVNVSLWKCESFERRTT